MSLGTGGVSGAVMMPQPESASPPMVFVGTGSGSGGSPAFGTSDESTAGGVVTLNGQSGGGGAGAGAATGSAVAVGAITKAGAASIVNAASTEDPRMSARVEILRKVAIVSEG
jgi:hypothetical protein